MTNVTFLQIHDGIFFFFLRIWWDLKSHPYSLLKCHHQSLYHDLFGCIFHLILYVHVSSTNRQSSSRLWLYFCTTAPPGDPACILCQLTITPEVGQIKTWTRDQIRSEQKTSVITICLVSSQENPLQPRRLFASLNWILKLV